MGPAEWIALGLGVATTLVAVVPFALRRSDRQRVEIEKYRVANQLLRDSNWDLKLQVHTLTNRLDMIADRTFSALPRTQTLPPAEGSSGP